MNEQTRQRTVGGLAAAIVLLMAGRGFAETKEAVVGQLVSPDASLFQRSKPAEAWRAVSQNGKLPAGAMLVGLPGAVLESSKGAVRLSLLTDMDKNSPYPIFEAAVILHDSTDCDLDFTLDRGRVDVTNIKNKGPARVRIRFHNQKWEATLAQPGTRIALELYGRWPKGARFQVEPGPKDAPAADLLLLVRKGDVTVKHGDCQHAMSAPPGPALLHWDNSGEEEEAPTRLEKLPDWAATEASTSERAERIRKVVEEFRQQVVKSSPKAALEEFAKSEDRNHRFTAVIFMGALDDLEGLGNVLTATKYPDTWDRAVETLRHWIGRRAGQDQIIYRLLVDKRMMSPVHAQTILQLLHSFGDADLAQPELYKMLVRFLDHEKLGVRGLAHWHLVRLVPAGKKFEYDPLAPKEKRDKARDQWKKLIDDMLAKGELPPKDLPN